LTPCRRSRTCGTKRPPPFPAETSRWAASRSAPRAASSTPVSTATSTLATARAPLSAQRQTARWHRASVGVGWMAPSVVVAVKVATPVTVARLSTSTRLRLVKCHVREKTTACSPLPIELAAPVVPICLRVNRTTGRCASPRHGCQTTSHRSQTRRLFPTTTPLLATWHTPQECCLLPTPVRFVAWAAWRLAVKVRIEVVVGTKIADVIFSK